jgi:predicted glycosyltransferase involved in capsule biosynthesis
MGGHDERFEGHGAEDFELLHRLSRHYPIRKELPRDYSMNTGSGPIKEYRGFRAYFSLYGDSCYREGLCLVHLYHPKRKIFGYYKHRKNFRLLKKIMEQE